MSISALFLLLAILSEVFSTTMLKLSEGFTVIYATIGLIVGFAISFIFLGLSLKSIPLSSAYAIWSGLGTALTAAAGVLLFHEQLSFIKIFALVFIIVGVILLNKSKDEQEQKSADTH